MGADKALLRVDGQPMATRVAVALREAGASRVICVGGDLDALESLGLEVMADRWPGEGPLGGILSALGALRADGDADVDGDTGALVVAPCDLLVPDPALFGAVIAALREHDADVAVPVVRGVRQPLNGAFRRSARESLQRLFDQGERSVRRALLSLKVHEVETPAPGGLADADWPSDLSRRR